MHMTEPQFDLLLAESSVRSPVTSLYALLWPQRSSGRVVRSRALLDAHGALCSVVDHDSVAWFAVAASKDISQLVVSKVRVERFWLFFWIFLKIPLDFCRYYVIMRGYKTQTISKRKHNVS